MLYVYLGASNLFTNISSIFTNYLIVYSFFYKRRFQIEGLLDLQPLLETRQGLKFGKP